MSLINSLRASNGLPPLAVHSSLTTRARNWSKRMAENGKLGHSDLSGLLGEWTGAGENVGRGGSVQGLFDALADSPGHRANMLAQFTHIGVGVWQAADGTLWTTHVFVR